MNPFTFVTFSIGTEKTTYFGFILRNVACSNWVIIFRIERHCVHGREIILRHWVPVLTIVNSFRFRGFLWKCAYIDKVNKDKWTTNVLWASNLTRVHTSFEHRRRSITEQNHPLVHRAFFDIAIHQHYDRESFIFIKVRRNQGCQLLIHAS